MAEEFTIRLMAMATLPRKWLAELTIQRNRATGMMVQADRTTSRHLFLLMVQADHMISVKVNAEKSRPRPLKRLGFSFIIFT